MVHAANVAGYRRSSSSSNALRPQACLPFKKRAAPRISFENDPDSGSDTESDDEWYLDAALYHVSLYWEGEEVDEWQMGFNARLASLVASRKDTADTCPRAP